MQPIDAATVKLLADPDDTHMYVNKFMKIREGEQNDQNFWFSTPKISVKENDHTPIQRRKLKVIRELIKKEELDSTKDAKLRKEFLSMFKWEGSFIEGKDREQSEQQL